MSNELKAGAELDEQVCKVLGMPCATAPKKGHLMRDGVCDLCGGNRGEWHGESYYTCPSNHGRPIYPAVSTDPACVVTLMEGIETKFDWTDPTLRRCTRNNIPRWFASDSLAGGASATSDTPNLALCKLALSLEKKP